MPPNTAFPVPSISGTGVTLVCGTWTSAIKTAVLHATAAGQAGRTPRIDPRFVGVGYWWVQAAA